jgi:hypothetical protein
MAVVGVAVVTTATAGRVVPAVAQVVATPTHLGVLALLAKVLVAVGRLPDSRPGLAVEVRAVVSRRTRPAAVPALPT